MKLVKELSTAAIAILVLTVLLAGTVVLIGALTFFPAFLLGPVVQGMTDRLF